MEPFATPQDMADRTQGAITATSHPFLQSELDAATRAIQNYCGWHIAPIEPHTYTHVRPWREHVWIPAMQIRSIDSATVDGQSVAPTDVTFDPDIGWTSLCACSVEVTYTSGFAEIPADLVQLTLALAAGGLGASLGQTREQAGGVSITFGRAGGALQTEPGSADAALLAPYRIGRLP